ncbi:hypothetical protein FQZ97_887910 [compost metagenome]
MRHAHAGAELGVVGRVQVYVAVAAAVDVILDIADDAIALVVHDNKHHVGLLLGGTGQLTHVEHETAVAAQGERFTP